MIALSKEIGFSGLLDIVFIAVLIYSVLVWFKQTRAQLVLRGLALVGAAYLLARLLDLSLTTTVFQAFFAIIVVALVIIFQEEIKHVLEQLASRSTFRNLRSRRLLQLPRREIEIIVQTLYGLARERVGALLVLWGKDPIGRHLTGGVDLNGEISEPVIRSIFDPHSMGHDGAAIIRGDKIVEFGAYLPLSRNLRKLKSAGTRHAAGLGLSELTDALCLVVSEERGTISVAHRGSLRPVNDIEELRSLIVRFYEEILPAPVRRRWTSLIITNYREKIIAVLVTLFLWFFFVFGSRTEYRTFMVPVGYSALPERMEVTSIDPPAIEVTLSGPRRVYYALDAVTVRLDLKLGDVRPGAQWRTVTRTNISYPQELVLETIQPSEVMLQITRSR